MPRLSNASPTFAAAPRSDCRATPRPTPTRSARRAGRGRAPGRGNFRAYARRSYRDVVGRHRAAYTARPDSCRAGGDRDGLRHTGIQAAALPLSHDAHLRAGDGTSVTVDEAAVGLSQVMLWDTDRPYHYARWTSDGRLLLGGGDRPLLLSANARAPSATASTTFAPTFSAYPSLADVAIDYSWEGLFAVTPDGLPYVGSPSTLSAPSVCPWLRRQRHDVRLPRGRAHL